MECVLLLSERQGICDILFDIWMIICDAPLLSENMNLVIKYCNEFFGLCQCRLNVCPIVFDWLERIH